MSWLDLFCSLRIHRWRQGVFLLAEAMRGITDESNLLEAPNNNSDSAFSMEDPWLPKTPKTGLAFISPTFFGGSKP